MFHFHYSFFVHGSQAFRLLLRHFFLLASHDDNNAGPPLLELSCLVDSPSRGGQRATRARTALFRELHLADDLWAFLEPPKPLGYGLGGPGPLNVAPVASGCFLLDCSTIRYRYAYPGFFLVFCPDHALFSSRRRLFFFCLSCTYHPQKCTADVTMDGIDFFVARVLVPAFSWALHAVDLEATKAGTCIYRNLPLHSCVPPWGRENGAGFHSTVRVFSFFFAAFCWRVLYVGTSTMQYGAHATTRLLHGHRQLAR
ncbi:hypothetical protein J3F84DRAFT_220253 [Trichoderma pleuroticola]